MFQNHRRNLAANAGEKQVEPALIGAVFPPTIFPNDPRPTLFAVAQFNRIVRIGPITAARGLIIFCLIGTDRRLPCFIDAEQRPYDPDNGDQTEQFWQ